MSKHEHYWSFLHTVWAAGDGSSQRRCLIARYCAGCGKRQQAFAERWRPLSNGAVDIHAEIERRMKT